MDALEIKNIRKSLGLTQADFAKKIGVSRDTVINYERGDKIPDSKIEMLNNLLLENEPTSLDLKPTGFYYPDVSASAGLETEMQNDELNKIPINIPNWGNDLSFINVYGDSMYPKFCSGEIIGIKEVELQYLNYGFAYVVILKDGQVLLKFIKKSEKENHIILESENDFYEPKEYSLDQLKKVFIIKGVITKTTM